jgi:hypothetical protein
MWASRSFLENVLFRDRGKRMLASGGPSLVAGWYYPGSLDHEDHASLRSARPMHYPFRNRKPLSGCELDSPALQVNYEAPPSTT